MTDLDLTTGRVASSQHGILTRGQARGLGFTPSQIERRRRSGRWISVHSGVYRVHGAPETWHSQLISLCFALDGFASHRSAAALKDVDGIRPGVLEISVPVGRRVPKAGVIIHESTDLQLFDAELIHGTPTTPAGRLVCDLGAVVRFDRFDRAVDDLIRRKLLTWDEAFDQLVRHARRGRNGIGALRALLEERYGSDVGESAFEGAFIRELRRRGFLEPVPQFTVRDRAGFIARVDFAYPALRLAIELDGRKYHGDPVFEADRDKRLRLATAGWLVVEITWTMLTTDPGKVFRRLGKVIRERQAASA